MDPALDLQARRLLLSATLTTHVLQRIGGRIVPASDARDLLVLARNLDAERVERAHRLSFEPSYPGVTAGVEATSSGTRLLLACQAFDRDGAALGVVFTTLIPSRLPQVSVAPSATPIPQEWRPPSKSS
jgi:hypothetical protein